MRAPELDNAVDFADDRLFLGLTGLEKLGNSRQTAGDVFCLCGFPRYLGKNIAGSNEVSLVNKYVRSSRAADTAQGCWCRDSSRSCRGHP